MQTQTPSLNPVADIVAWVRDDSGNPVPLRRN